MAANDNLDLILRRHEEIAARLAEGVSGSIENFAAEMNRNAQRLGMSQTNYVNPNGLPADEQITSARDLAILARALIHRPPVLLLDEPTLGLDILGSQVVAEFVEHLRAEGKAVILTTHHLDEAERLCDRFGLLHRGRLIQTGTLPELRQITGCAGLVEMFLKLAHTGPMLAE